MFLLAFAFLICTAVADDINLESLPTRPVSTSSVPPGSQGVAESLDSLFNFDEQAPRIGQHSIRKCQKHKGKICVFGAERVEDKEGNFLAAMVAWVQPDLNTEPTISKEEAINGIHDLIVKHKRQTRALEETEKAKKERKNKKETHKKKAERKPRKETKKVQVQVQEKKEKINLLADLIVYPSINETGGRTDFLAWHVTETNNIESSWNCILDAHEGQLLTCWNDIQTALVRKTYDAKNSTYVPGTLVRTEGSLLSKDDCINVAHDNANKTYTFYNKVYGRDSYDNQGAAIISSVHYKQKYNNAFWSTQAKQMVYGDGDGNVFRCLAYGLDIVGHELSHALTSTESALLYQGESGAINEGISDILGAAIELYDTDQTLTKYTNDTFKIGENAFTPTIEGDALRYMCDPKQGGETNSDYYPKRYEGKDDNGGVHRNAGIVTLCFCLLVKGGYHPRGQSSNYVESIGFKDALDIFYYANTNYLASSAKFADLRAATLTVASTNWGSNSTQYIAVMNAWDAVGVFSPEDANSTSIISDPNTGISLPIVIPPDSKTTTPTPVVVVSTTTPSVPPTTQQAGSNVCWGKVAAGHIEAKTRMYIPNSKGFTSDGLLLKAALGGESRDRINLTLQSQSKSGTWTTVNSHRVIELENQKAGTYRWFIQTDANEHFSLCYTQE